MNWIDAYASRRPVMHLLANDEPRHLVSHIDTDERHRPTDEEVQSTTQGSSGTSQASPNV
jgi:hypothetical protein